MTDPSESSQHSAEMDAHRRKVEEARVALCNVPWWRPIKRQDAAREYRYALLAGALVELRTRPTAPVRPAQ